MQIEKNTHLALCLLGIVCDRDRIKDVETALAQHKTFFSLVTFGMGTANSKILSYLGLGETEKGVFLCVLPREETVKVLDEVDVTLELTMPGQGIAFMMEIENGCYKKPVQFVNEDGEANMQNDAAHDLVITVLNRGYCEDVMDVARAAGATGGTVLNARGCGAAGAEKFFGMVIAPEKEMIWIVTPKGVSCEIMAAIAESVGPMTDAGAVSFTMPVSHVRGINFKKLDM